jgi:hypothetical protein
MDTLLELEFMLVLQHPALRYLSRGQQAKLCYKLADLYPWQSLSALDADAKRALIGKLAAIPSHDEAVRLLNTDAGPPREAWRSRGEG